MSWDVPDYTVVGSSSGQASVAITDQGGGTFRLTYTGYTSPAPFGADVVGKYLTIRGAANAANDGVYPITAYDSGSGLWVDYSNAAGVAEVSPMAFEIRAAATAHDMIARPAFITATSGPTLYRWPHGMAPLTGAQLANHGTNCFRVYCPDVSHRAQAFYMVADRAFMGGDAVSVRVAGRTTYGTYSGIPGLVARVPMSYGGNGVNVTAPGYCLCLYSSSSPKLYIGSPHVTNVSYAYYLNYSTPAPAGGYVTGPAVTYALDDWHALRLDVTTEGPNVRLRAYVINGYAAVDQMLIDPAWTEVANLVHVFGSVTPDTSDMPAGYTHTGVGGFYDTTPQYDGSCGFVVPPHTTAAQNHYVDSFVAKRMAA